jgi:hypothetical protein
MARMLGVDAHARQTAVTVVIAVTVDADTATIAATMMEIVGRIAVVMVGSDGKSIALCGVMMVMCGVMMAALTVAATMVGNVAADTVVLPPRSWT